MFTISEIWSFSKYFIRIFHFHAGAKMTDINKKDTRFYDPILSSHFTVRHKKYASRPKHQSQCKTCAGISSLPLQRLRNLPHGKRTFYTFHESPLFVVDEDGGKMGDLEKYAQEKTGIQPHDNI